MLMLIDTRLKRCYMLSLLGCDNLWYTLSDLQSISISLINESLTKAVMLAFFTSTLLLIFNVRETNIDQCEYYLF